MRNQSGKRVQLHRAFSKLGWGSRTQAWEWIQSGTVCVDGQVLTDPLTWVDLDRQHITRCGLQPAPLSPLTLALHKPRAIVTTRKDERQRRTVYDLLPPGLPWVFPAGRLDADSEGLLILTNDSALAMRLTDPKHHVPKVYRVTLRGRPATAAVDQLRRGITLKDGPTRPVRIEVIEEGDDVTVVEMILTEGRNRQVRRMWATFGHKVRRLIRVAIGGYALGDLAAGKCRPLDHADIHRLTEE